MGECFQWKAHGQCSKGDRPTQFQSSHNDFQQRWQRSGTKKDDRLLLHQIRRQRMTARDKNPQKNRATKRKALQSKGAKFHADSGFVKTGHVDFGIFPGTTQQKIHTKKMRKDQGVNTIGLYSSILIRENVFNMNLENWDRNTPSKFSKSTWHKKKFGKRKGPSRGIIQKCALHERSPYSPKFEERSHEETLHQEGCARRAAWDLAKIFTS